MVFSFPVVSFHKLTFNLFEEEVNFFSILTQAYVQTTQLFQIYLIYAPQTFLDQAPYTEILCSVIAFPTELLCIIVGNLTLLPG